MTRRWTRGWRGGNGDRAAAQDAYLLALELVGATVQWHHQSAAIGERLTVTGATVDGRVTLAQYPGEFAPHLFRVVVTP